MSYNCLISSIRISALDNIMSQLRQIIYISSAPKELGGSSLDSLLEEFRTRNKQKDITGILLYHYGSFIQVIEGETETIDDLFSKIQADQRHKRLICLSDEIIDYRDFSNWRMGYVNVESNPPEGLIDLVEFYESGEHATIKDGRAKTLLLSFKKNHSNSIL